MCHSRRWQPYLLYRIKRALFTFTFSKDTISDLNHHISPLAKSVSQPASHRPLVFGQSKKIEINKKEIFMQNLNLHYRPITGDCINQFAADSTLEATTKQPLCRPIDTTNSWDFQQFFFFAFSFQTFKNRIYFHFYCLFFVSPKYVTPNERAINVIVIRKIFHSINLRYLISDRNDNNEDMCY